MSALTSLFTAMANKIRSKVGGSDTYTPTEMVSAIDDVYDAGIADATTDITPSNANPVPLSANTGYKPTAAGYAIDSYTVCAVSTSASAVINPGEAVINTGSNTGLVCVPTEITPSDENPANIDALKPIKATVSGKAIRNLYNATPSNDSPATLTKGKIYSINNNNGYAVASITSVTPSDIYPASITTGNIYKSTGSGRLVELLHSLIPSDSSPDPITANDVYNALYNGYAISSQPSNKTPDDTTPPSVSSGEIVKMGGAGYLYATQQTGVATGTVAIAATTSTEYTINTGITNLTRFGLHAYSNKTAYGKNMQFYNQWDSSDPTNQYVLSKYSSNGGNTYTALSSTAIATAITIESVTNGVVKIKSPSNTNWNDLSLEWWAW